MTIQESTQMLSKEASVTLLSDLLKQAEEDKKELLEVLTNLSQAVTELQWDVGELPTLKESWDASIKLRVAIMTAR